MYILYTFTLQRKKKKKKKKMNIKEALCPYVETYYIIRFSRTFIMLHYDLNTSESAFLSLFFFFHLQHRQTLINV